jgi:hypothetical protein
LVDDPYTYAGADYVIDGCAVCHYPIGAEVAAALDAMPREKSALVPAAPLPAKYVAPEEEA